MAKFNGFSEWLMVDGYCLSDGYLRLLVYDGELMVKGYEFMIS